MKHKAQEALDTLYDEAACECEVDEDTGELQLFYCTNHDKYLNMREPLQQLIDRQIPYKYLQMLCVVVKENIDRLEKKARKFEREGKFSYLAVYSELIEQHKQIIEVLHKQKEILEEEE